MCVIQHKHVRGCTGASLSQDCRPAEGACTAAGGHIAAEVAGSGHPHQLCGLLTLSAHPHSPPLAPQVPQYLHEAGWTAQGHQVRGREHKQQPHSSLLSLSVHAHMVWRTSVFCLPNSTNSLHDHGLCSSMPSMPSLLLLL